jgi:hypothetical protein
MPLALLLALLSAGASAEPARAPAAVSAQGFEQRFAAAQGDVERLWDLWLWCEAGDHQREGRQVLRAILELNPEHRPAHEALGHTQHDGRWFASKKDLERYMREEQERIAREKGLVRWKGEWVDPLDLPYLERGYVRGVQGGWLTREEQARLRGGWARQDLEWIPPAERAKVEAGLWRCGEEWLPLAEADAWHAELGRWWRIPGRWFNVYSTCPRELTLHILEVLERTREDLLKIYGWTPFTPPIVVVLNDKHQYDRLGVGIESLGVEPGDSRGLAQLHGAFFADRALDPATGEPMNCGVGFWDSSMETGANFGLHSVRHAAGLSWAGALERSLREELDGKRRRKRGEPPPEPLPDWFRIGAAVYVERWFVDNLTASDGNPNWARDWAKKSLARRGGRMPLADFFAHVPNLRERKEELEHSQRWLNQSGLVLAFVLEGGSEEVRLAHEALKGALGAGEGLEPAFAALRDAILAHEAELSAFAER